MATSEEKVSDCTRYVVNGQFKVVTEKDGKETAECIVCGTVLKYHHSTTTLKYHLAKKHPFTAANKEKVELKQQQHSILNFTNARVQSRVTDKHKDDIVKALCVWIGKDMRPVNVLEDDGLRDVIRIATKDITFTLPCRTTAMEKVKDLFQSEKLKQMEKLCDAESVVFAFDHWTSMTQDNYMGVTAVFLTKSFHLQHTTLGIYCSNESQTGENIRDHVTEVISQWNITDKVFSLCSDNAANMLKASRLLNIDHLPCMAHTLQLAINHGIKECGISSLLAKSRSIVSKVRKSPKQKGELKKMGCKHMLVRKICYPSLTKSIYWYNWYLSLHTLSHDASKHAHVHLLLISNQ